MHKNKGQAQQIRGHKRRAKVLNMRKNRNPNSIKPEPGAKYMALILGINEEKENNNG